MLILAYHRVNPGAKDGLSVTPSMLEDQLLYLQTCGWENVMLDEQALSGQLMVKAKKFAITFDDGYRDNYLHAFPLLKRLGMRATVFVSSGYVDTGQPFPWVSKRYQGNALQQEDLPLNITKHVPNGGF